MPSLSFVLPHWLYWGTLILFPLVAIYLVARQHRQGVPRKPSLFVAYLFWLTAGFAGLHRFYLRSLWGFAFIPVFLGILFVNDTIRDKREDVSRTRSAYEGAHSVVLRARRISPSAPDRAERLARAEAAEEKVKADFDAAQADIGRWRNASLVLAILMAGMLAGDAVLLPRLVRKTSEREPEPPLTASDAPVADILPTGTQEDPTLGLHTRLTDAIETVNVRIGEFAAYWAVISVFVYYYEVIARFVFNSPTNWVHESMFLMYGMQYMLAGAYAYREDQHVRVDVFYSKFSPRGKALADIVTSVFFFIFIGTMLVTGYRFAADAVNLREVSFTEWGVQYWPVKLSIPIGSGLLLLQGLSKLIKDVVFLSRARA
jgi:TRAP-type mannitol/chloroaromatic compound transport system permease small subunit